MPLPVIFISPDQHSLETALKNELKQYNLTFEHPDVLVLSDKIGVEQIKKVHEHLFWKSGNKSKRVIVFFPVETMTIDAQNGLLKILEEPVGDSVILFAISDEHLLLQTIVSRCQMTYLPNSLIEYDVSDIPVLLSLSVEMRLEKIEKNDDRKKLIDSLAHFYHQKLPDNPELLNSLKLVLESRQWITQHVPAKAVSDYLMISLPIYKQ